MRLRVPALLALAVTAGLVVAPAASPARADGLLWTGDLRYGGTVETTYDSFDSTRPGVAARGNGLIEVFDDPACQSFAIDRVRSPWTVPDDAGYPGRSVRFTDPVAGTTICAMIGPGAFPDLSVTAVRSGDTLDLGDLPATTTAPADTTFIVRWYRNDDPTPVAESFGGYDDLAARARLAPTAPGTYRVAVTQAQLPVEGGGGFEHFVRATSEATVRFSEQVVVPQVGVSGTPRVDVPLTASLAAATTPSDADVSWQWSADGAPIEGATQAVYTPDATKVGAVLSVVATGTSTPTDYDPGTSSATLAAVAPGEIAGFAAGVSGLARVGRTLTATVTGTPSSEVTYQWLADGREIAGATAATLPVTPSLFHQRLSVRAVGARAGYDTATAVSTATPAVTMAASRLRLDVGRAAPGRRVAFRATSMAPGRTWTLSAPGLGRLARGTVPASGVVTGSFRVPTKAVPGRRITVSVVTTAPRRVATDGLRITR